MWAKNVFPALSRVSSYTEDLEARMLHQWEQIAEVAVSDWQLWAFATTCSPQSMEPVELMAILGTYCGRKGLNANMLFWNVH